MANPVPDIRIQFRALSAAATSLNKSSDELTQALGVLDSALKKLNLGLLVWVPFSHVAMEDPAEFDREEIGYAKVGGQWGIALRRIWGHSAADEFNLEGPWMFGEAPREMRIRAVDHIFELIAKLVQTASETTAKIQRKTSTARQLAATIAEIDLEQKKGSER
ncbi:MAG: hypothetical protein WAM91_17490 [Candidatus Acidiferrales bacterium]